MRRFFFIPLLLFPASILLGQTPRIAHKSHSGSSADYYRALETGFSDIGYSNFGMAPTREVKNAQLDSVIFLTDSTAVMVTSEYCSRVDRASGKPVSDPKKWKAGRDTVLRHPLFSRQHALDSIRRVLQAEYHFQNPAEKVVFLGYDNDSKKPKRKQKRQDFLPVMPEGPGSGPFDPHFYGILAAIIGLSALTATLIHFRFRSRLRKSSGQPA